MRGSAVEDGDDTTAIEGKRYVVEVHYTEGLVENMRVRMCV